MQRVGTTRGLATCVHNTHDPVEDRGPSQCQCNRTVNQSTKAGYKSLSGPHNARTTALCTTHLTGAKLMQEITLTLPVAIDDQITDRVKRLATEHWGGFTETTARGGWESPSGEVVTEKVNVLTVLAENEHERDGTTPKQWAETMARVVSEESEQESVMWFVRQIHAGGFE